MNRVQLVFRGTSQRGRTERTRPALQECGAIFRLFVLMLCHRPVHTQTHILSCSALTLSLVSSTAEVRGKTMFHFLTQALTVRRGCTIPQISFVATRHLCFMVCVRTVFTRGALTVGPSLDSQPPVRPCFSPTPFIFYNTGSVRSMQRLLSLGQHLHSFSFTPTIPLSLTQVSYWLFSPPFLPSLCK